MTEIIPAIDIIDGRCVRLTKGDYAQKKVYDYSPVEMALRFADCGVQRIHMVDLDGARLSQPKNLRILEETASRTGKEIEWGGGIAGSDFLKQVFDAGASQAIIGSMAALEPERFREWLKKYSGERIILGSDVRDGKIAVRGWKEQTSVSLNEQIGWFTGDGLKNVICTEISRDGMLQGPAVSFYAELLPQFPGISFTASGGVSSMSDIGKLDGIGMHYAIVGKAIYEGRISLKDIEKWELQRG